MPQYSLDPRGGQGVHMSPQALPMLYPQQQSRLDSGIGSRSAHSPVSLIYVKQLPTLPSVSEILLMNDDIKKTPNSHK